MLSIIVGFVWVLQQTPLTWIESSPDEIIFPPHLQENVDIL